jgi:hypothetical protein
VVAIIMPTVLVNNDVSQSKLLIRPKDLFICSVDFCAFLRVDFIVKVDCIAIEDEG